MFEGCILFQKDYRILSFKHSRTLESQFFVINFLLLPAVCITEEIKDALGERTEMPDEHDWILLLLVTHGGILTNARQLTGLERC
ncbi:unnamed protein product [Caretta caretta]